MDAAKALVLILGGVLVAEILHHHKNPAPELSLKERSSILNELRYKLRSGQLSRFEAAKQLETYLLDKNQRDLCTKTVFNKMEITICLYGFG